MFPNLPVPPGRKKVSVISDDSSQTYHETTTERDDQEPMNDLEQPESREELELDVAVTGGSAFNSPVKHSVLTSFVQHQSS